MLKGLSNFVQSLRSFDNAPTKRIRRVTIAKTVALTGCLLLPSYGQASTSGHDTTTVQSHANVQVSEHHTTVQPQTNKLTLGLGDWDFISETDAKTLSTAGLKTWRANLDWSYIEQQPGEYRWQALDALAQTAWQNNIQLVLVVNGCPSWVCHITRSGPISDWQLQQFSRFLTVAVRRYAKPGFVDSSKIVALSTTWQIYNEINAGADWPHPKSRDYAKVVAMATNVVKSVDPQATVVAAGMTQNKAVSGGKSGLAMLKQLYRQPGWQSADVIAIHGYAKSPKQTAQWIAQVKALQRKHHDTRPLWMTEFSWGSNQGQHPFAVGPAKQARYMSQTLALTDKSVQRAYWFGLHDLQEGALPGAQAWSINTGLMGLGGRPKPSYSRFTQLLGKYSAKR